VNNSGNSANTNVISANVQVDPKLSARNDSANVVVSDNENVSANQNDNDNDADADADAGAGNANLNVNAGVNELTNTNSDGNSNTSSNTGSNTNSGSNTGVNANNPPSSQALCASFGGTFTFVGSPAVVWTCNGLPGLPPPESNARFETMFSACIADGGAGLESNSAIPEDLTCLQTV
jgi:hypothetical protein